MFRVTDPVTYCTKEQLKINMSMLTSASDKLRLREKKRVQRS